MTNIEIFNEAAMIERAALARAEEVTGKERAEQLSIAREASSIHKLALSRIDTNNAINELRKLVYGT